MYVASQLDTSWLLNVQRKLYAQSRKNPDYVFRKLWGLITDLRNLRIALSRVAQNKGKRTAGVDGLTVRTVLEEGAEAFVEHVRAELRSGAYRPSPVRRVLIPKPGQPTKHRPLGIPTVKDRVVQAAVKNILEPIFEADFYPTSYGFRPSRSAHLALAYLRVAMRPLSKLAAENQGRLPYQWAVEGDIKGCFDNIDHHGLMVRVRRRVLDPKVNRLVVAFLRAGVMSEGQFSRTEAGTPQGGILSPLLANIALAVLDERYERWVRPRRAPTPLTSEDEIHARANRNRRNDRQRKRVVFLPVRYVDDFIILVGVPHGPNEQQWAEAVALQEKAAIAKLLKDELGLELSEAKTLVSPVTSRMRFLGHHVLVRRHPTFNRVGSTALIPKDKSQRLREAVKDLFRKKRTGETLERLLNRLNPILRGWSNYYRHASGAKKVFGSLDHYVWWTIYRWLRKKHPTAGRRKPVDLYGMRYPGRRTIHWREGSATCFRMSSVKVCRYRFGWARPPDFASTSMESPVHSERCTPGSERGARKPAGESR